MKKPYYYKRKRGKKKTGLGISIFDYKNPELLLRFMDSRGQIKNRVLNGTTAKEQRRLSKAIKRSRQMGLSPIQIVEQKVNLKRTKTQ
ncbi:MAG: 30S ribosomal protein S18 [Candidatus Moeniiplasma glomeromycotorum]|nr:30S ribosomal protein S18 [Candidatus Moeniiplasma glomeromycotorum]MCE8167457.1 30S ribosomal protein S18 [Candidatus Moeniiplasma glomeromycotorum]MCE8168529.1 30S ribosomal protein S18 [Candidatus Moeniiplasma glomeromycotorum]